MKYLQSDPTSDSEQTTCHAGVAAFADSGKFRCLHSSRHSRYAGGLWKKSSPPRRASSWRRINGHCAAYSSVCLRASSKNRIWLGSKNCSMNWCDGSKGWSGRLTPPCAPWRVRRSTENSRIIWLVPATSPQSANHVPNRSKSDCRGQSIILPRPSRMSLSPGFSLALTSLWGFLRKSPWPNH